MEFGRRWLRITLHIVRKPEGQRTFEVLAGAGSSNAPRPGWCVADTLLGERYRRIARRSGKKKAVVAVGRSILVIVWHLLSDDEARFRDLGPGFYDSRLGPERAKLNHIRHLQALGYKVTLEPAA